MINFIFAFLIGYWVGKSDHNNQYRVSPDLYLGWEVQVKRWWLPIWLDISLFGGTNTYDTKEQAQSVVDNFIEVQK